MNKMKSLYEAPTTDILVVRFEENILSGGAGNDDSVFNDEDY